MDNLPKWEEATFDQPEEQLPSWDEAQFEQSPSEPAAPSKSEEPSDWRKTGRDFLIGAVESIPGSRQMVGAIGAGLGQDYEAGKQYLKEQEEKAAEQSPWAHGTGEVVGTAAQIIPGAAAIRPLFTKKVGEIASDVGQNAIARLPEDLSSIAPEKLLEMIKQARASSNTIKNVGLKVADILPFGIASGVQEGAKNYGENGDVTQAELAGLKSGAIGTLGAAAVPLATKGLELGAKGLGKVQEQTLGRAARVITPDVSKYFPQLNQYIKDKMGENATNTLVGTLGADLLGGHGAFTGSYLASKIGQKSAAGLASAMTPKTAISMDGVPESVSNLEPYGMFSTLSNYLSPKEKQKKAEDDFQNGNNNTYNKEE